MDWAERLARWNYRTQIWTDVDRVVDAAYPRTRLGYDKQIDVAKCTKALRVFWKRVWSTVVGNGAPSDSFWVDRSRYEACMRFLLSLVVYDRADLNEPFRRTHTFFQLCELAMVERGETIMDRDADEGPAMRVVYALQRSPLYKHEMRAFLMTYSSGNALMLDVKEERVCCCCKNGYKVYAADTYYENIPTSSMHMVGDHVYSGRRCLG